MKHLFKYIVKLIWFNKIYNRVTILKENVSIGNSWEIDGRICVHNKGSILIGSNVRVNSSSKYNIIGGDTRTNFIINENSFFKVGNNVGISNSTFVCRVGITIEDDVLIGGGCKIYDNDFHSLDIEIRKMYFKNNQIDLECKAMEIRLCKGAWICGHSIILKGVTVGENSIVGAGSVVTKSIPSNEIWAGNPAVFIRKV